MDVEIENEAETERLSDKENKSDNDIRPELE
jgi:hypothetical protein